MFDDKTYDEIMADMMKRFGQGVRTDEGSLAFNACAKISEKLEDVYADMDAINDNMLPDTQDISHLIRYAKGVRAIEYHYATAPEVKAVFQQEIEINEQFVCNDYTYIVSDKIEGYEYRLICETEGTEANTNFGELEPVDYVDEYLGGRITEVIVPGTDDEDEEEFRQRVIDSFKSKAFGGNKADYRLFIDALDGVGGCKPKRREADSPWIEITVISSMYDIPSETLINDIQTAIDPEQNHGEGDGMAPICHNVLIKPVEGSNLSIDTTITFDDGYSIETSKSLIESAVDIYFRNLRSIWESNELNDTIVRIAQIEAKILTVEGVLDVEDTTINGSGENYILNYAQIPILGGVNINV